ncbi:MAG: S41 family peptidase [Pirellulales bacterium]|nr:S41 family peptidase [Pirellulales bacterium]
MLRWVSPAIRALVLGFVVSLSISGVGYAQTPPAVVDSSASVIDEVLRRGGELELERRWAEALVHYEKALREHPSQRQLEERCTLSKIHYDLGRRYHDASFLDATRTMSEKDALGLYSEVLLKIQHHYVDNLDWKRLVDRGTRALDEALIDPIFLERNLPGIDPQRILRYRQDLRTSFSTRRVADRYEAQAAVRAASALARQQLGLAPAVVVFEYTCGAANYLDEYSAFLTADQLNEVYSQIDGNFVGLGVELKSGDGSLEIVGVITGSPAAKGGVLAGDRIIAVDGRSTENVNSDEAADLLQGPEGSTVEITLRRQGGTHTVRLRRQQVEVPSVEDIAIHDKDFGIGYFRLTCFQKTTTRDIDAALWQLHRQGMRSLIMDLRGNPGGLLNSSVEVVDRFVSRGTIVSTRGRDPREDYTYSAHDQGTWGVPLVVLIDRDSASASEIFAGAIRDHRRGVIVGERSYGKGSVQGIFPLGFSRTGLRLTTAKFYSPSGQPFARVGVQPDVLVPELARPTGLDGAEGLSLDAAGATEVDPALAAALRVSRQQMASRATKTAE